MDGAHKNEQQDVSRVPREMETNNVGLKNNDNDKKEKKEKKEKKDKKEKKENSEMKFQTCSQQLNSENIKIHNSHYGIMSTSNSSMMSSDSTKINKEMSKSVNSDISCNYKYNLNKTISNKSNENNRTHSHLSDVKINKNKSVNRSICNFEETKGGSVSNEVCVIPTSSNTTEGSSYVKMSNTLGNKNNLCENKNEHVFMNTIKGVDYLGDLSWREKAISTGNNFNRGYRSNYSGSTIMSGNNSCKHLSVMNRMQSLNNQSATFEKEHIYLNGYAGCTQEGVSKYRNNMKTQEEKFKTKLNCTNITNLKKGIEVSNMNSVLIKNDNLKKKAKNMDLLAGKGINGNSENLFANLKIMDIDNSRKDDDVMREKNNLELFNYEKDDNFERETSNLRVKKKEHDMPFSDNSAIPTVVTTSTSTAADITHLSSSNMNWKGMKNNIRVTTTENNNICKGNDMNYEEMWRYNTNRDDHTKLSSNTKSSLVSNMKKHFPWPINSSPKGNINCKSSGNGSINNNSNRNNSSRNSSSRNNSSRNSSSRNNSSRNSSSRNNSSRNNSSKCDSNNRSSTSGNDHANDKMSYEKDFLTNKKPHEKDLNSKDMKYSSLFIHQNSIGNDNDINQEYGMMESANGVMQNISVNNETHFKGNALMKGNFLNSLDSMNYKDNKLDTTTSKMSTPIKRQEELTNNQSDNLKFNSNDCFFHPNNYNIVKDELNNDYAELMETNFKSANSGVELNVKCMKPSYATTDSSIYTINNIMNMNKNVDEENDDLGLNVSYYDNENVDESNRNGDDGIVESFNYDTETHRNCERVIELCNCDEDIHLNYEEDTLLNHDDDIFSKNILNLNVKDDDLGNMSYFEKSSEFEENVTQLQKDLDIPSSLNNMNSKMAILNTDDSDENDLKYQQMNEIFSVRGKYGIPYQSKDSDYSFYENNPLGRAFNFDHSISSSSCNIGVNSNIVRSGYNNALPSHFYNTVRNLYNKGNYNISFQNNEEYNNIMKKNINDNKMLFTNNPNMNLNIGSSDFIKCIKSANGESTCGRNNDTVNSNLISEENNICNNDYTLIDDNNLGLSNIENSVENNGISMTSKNRILNACMNENFQSISESNFSHSKKKCTYTGNYVDDEIDSVTHVGLEHSDKNLSNGSYSMNMTKKKGAELSIPNNGTQHMSLGTKTNMNMQMLIESSFTHSGKKVENIAKVIKETNADDQISGDMTVESITGMSLKNCIKGNRSTSNIIKEGDNTTQSNQRNENETDSSSNSIFCKNEQDMKIKNNDNMAPKNSCNMSDDSTNSTNSNRSNESHKSCNNAIADENIKNINQNCCNAYKDYGNNMGGEGTENIECAENRKSFNIPDYNSEILNYEDIKFDNYSFKSEIPSNEKLKNNTFLQQTSSNLQNSKFNACANNTFINSIFNMKRKDSNSERNYSQEILNQAPLNINMKYNNNNTTMNCNNFNASSNNMNNVINMNRNLLNTATSHNDSVYHSSLKKKNEFSYFLMSNNPLDNNNRINSMTNDQEHTEMTNPSLYFSQQNIKNDYQIKTKHMDAIPSNVNNEENDKITFHMGNKIDNFGMKKENDIYQQVVCPSKNEYHPPNHEQNNIHKNIANRENKNDNIRKDANNKYLCDLINDFHEEDDNSRNLNIVDKNECMFRNIEEDIFKEVSSAQNDEMKYGALSSLLINNINSDMCGGIKNNGINLGENVGSDIPLNMFSNNCPNMNVNICDNLVDNEHFNDNLGGSMNLLENDVDYIHDENEEFENHSKSAMKGDKIMELQNIINSLKFKNKQLEKELTEVKNMHLKKKQNHILNSLSNKIYDISSYSTYNEDTNNSDCESADNSNKHIKNILNDKEKYNYDTKISIQKFHLAYTNNSIGKLKIAAQRDISGSFMGPKGIHVKTIKSSLHISVYKSAKDVWFPGFADSHVFLLKGNIFGILRACQLLYHYVKSKMSSSKCCIYLVAPFECVQKLLADGCKRMAIIKEECGADVRLGNLYVQVHEGFTERLMEIRGNEVSVDCALEKLVIFMQSCFSVQSYDYELLKYPCRSVLNLQ
ncbi:hypothetical protein, conserved [Plasmodium gonderi]|uniref:Uncharacterized protein n=1 Tax=Plasmodium gonderi TaxID=77519 RepID=A0A1Y1JHE0_PLAGO|nr:hypothetical protein, conserved [Plasmodium gonderi]GAW81660.1 hypothetical protein, conserved [Plasmodium gonderi]